MTCGRSFLGDVGGVIIVVYVDDVLFVRLGLVPLIIHFRVDLISVSSPLIVFYCRHFSFRILMPNKIHHHHRRLNLHEIDMHAMIPCFRSFILKQKELLRISIMNLINLIRSHRFRIFHHYLLRANPMHIWRSTRLVVVVMSSHRLMIITTISMMLYLRQERERRGRMRINHTNGNGFGVINNLMQCDLIYYRTRSHIHKAR